MSYSLVLALTLQLTLPATENGAMEKFPDLTQVKSFGSPDVAYFSSDLSFGRSKSLVLFRLRICGSNIEKEVLRYYKCSPGEKRPRGRAL